MPQGGLSGRLAIGGLLFGLAALAWHTGQGTRLVAFMPAVGYALVAHGFARTLRAGREPMIATFCRLDFGRVPAECVTYTRRLTAVWAIVMAALALEAATLALLAPSWIGLATLGNAVVMIGLFGGEHAVRLARFPHLPLSSPWRTGRIMLQALRERR